MPISLSTTLFFTSIPVAALLCGGAIAAFRPPATRWRSAIQHFAAGVVFAVVAVEILPDLRNQHEPWGMALSFGFGIAVMLGLRKFTERNEGQATTPVPLSWGLIVTVGIDLVIDGLLLGVGFAAGAKTGTLLALALTMECLSLGLATASSFAPSIPRSKVLLTMVLLAALFIIGAALGLTLLHNLSGEPFTWVLGFGCAALLYLVTEELLVEAHEVAETTFASAMFFVGFLIFLLLGMYES